MDVRECCREYVREMIRGGEGRNRHVEEEAEKVDGNERKMRDVGVGGVKVWIGDRETIGTLSLLFGKAEMNRMEIVRFLSTETTTNDEEEEDDDGDRPRRDDDGGSTAADPFMDAVIFVRPTERNVRWIERELIRPRFRSYALHFTNAVERSFVERLAAADAEGRRRVARGVFERYADYYALDPHLYVTSADGTDVSREEDAIVSRVLAVLLSLRRTPANVRYSAKSTLAASIARGVCTRIAEENAKDGLFDRHRERMSVLRRRAATSPRRPLLLIVDRADDPLTPLTPQWTYEAMLHECFRIHLKRIKRASSSSDELGEVLVDRANDAFFAKYAYESFGVVADAIQRETDAYRAEQRQRDDENDDDAALDDIERLQDKLDRVPELNARGRNIAKHLSLLSDLNAYVERTKVYEVNRVAQSLAQSNAVGGMSEAEHVDELTRIFRSSAYERSDKLRLLLMFALRHESSKSNIFRLCNAYDRYNAFYEEEDPRCSRTKRLVVSFVETMGASRRSGDLFRSRAGVLGGTFKLFKSLTAGTITHVEPVLRKTLDRAVRGTLDVAEYPFVKGSGVDASRADPPLDIIVFVVGAGGTGGVTYAESRAVRDMNASFRDGRRDDDHDAPRIVLGGSYMMNAHSFIRAIEARVLS